MRELRCSFWLVVRTTKISALCVLLWLQGWVPLSERYAKPGASFGFFVPALALGSRISAGSRKTDISAATNLAVNWVLFEIRHVTIGARDRCFVRASADQYWR